MAMGNSAVHRITHYLAGLSLSVFVIAVCFAVMPNEYAEAKSNGYPVVVSLGDSYSSGEGAEPFYGQNDAFGKYGDEDWLAHRSQKAWPGKLVIDGVELSSMKDDGWYFVASSGAETRHIMGDDEAGGVQEKSTGIIGDLLWDILDKDVPLPCQGDIFTDTRIKPGSIDFVTLTIGGNDLGFVDVVTDGVTETAKSGIRSVLEAEHLVTGWNIWEYLKDRPGLRSGTLKRNLNSAVATFKTQTLHRLSDLYDYVLDKAGNQATLVVAGYPHLFPDQGRAPFIDHHSAALINSAVDTFDSEVRKMIRGSKGDKVVFADPRPYFAGREASFINNILLGPQSQELILGTPVSAYSVHPNQYGQVAYAHAVQAEIDKLESSQSLDFDSDVAMSLVFDVSGSMNDSSAMSGMTKLESAQKQSSDFVSSVNSRKSGEGGLAVRVGVCSFSSTSSANCGLSNDPDDIKASISALKANGQTNMYAGLSEGITQLLGENGPRLMVFLSDGMSNVGGTRADILNLAHEAADEHIKVYTIGFGSSSDLDEDLLQEIADITGGEYSHEDSASISSAAVGLFAAMMNAQLQAKYELLHSAMSVVGLGDLVDAGKFDITKNGTVRVYLYWPGSVLDMQLTDPDGNQVAEGYSGYAIDDSTIPTSITIQNAKQGTWSMAVYGREVSLPEEPFYAAAAFEETDAPAVTAAGGGPSGGGEGLIFILCAVAVGCVIGVYAFTKRRGSHE